MQLQIYPSNEKLFKGRNPRLIVSLTSYGWVGVIHSSEGCKVICSPRIKREVLRKMGRLSIETGIPLFYESSRNYYR